MKNESNQTVVIGITGAIGSGKSTVAAMLSEKGYHVVTTDDLAKEIMVTNRGVMDNLIRAFGDKTFTESGELNRQYLAERVFAPGKQEELDKLNAIVHPAVIDEMIRISDEAEEKGEKLLFFESALIFEAELEEGFDYIIVVDAPEKIIIERAMQRTGAAEEEIRARLKNQIHPEEKKRAADFIIENPGSREDLERSLNFLLPIIESLPPKSQEEGEE